MTKRVCFFILVSVLPALFSSCASAARSGTPNRLKLVINEKSSIVCFGDSLTYGYGADISESYPAMLQKKVTLRVVNSGVIGDTTARALSRIEADVLAHNPVIVIIELGANDFFFSRMSNHRIDITSVENNFKKIIEVVRGTNSRIFLAKFYTNQIAVKLFNTDMQIYHEFEQMFLRLKEEYGIELINDIWKDIWGNSGCMYNQLHPNSVGYKIMAGHYYMAIQSLIEFNRLTAYPKVATK